MANNKSALDSSKYDAMTTEQLSRLPPNGAIYRAAFGISGARIMASRTAAQAANWERLLEYNRSKDGGMRGIGKLWNS